MSMFQHAIRTIKTVYKLPDNLYFMAETKWHYNQFDQNPPIHSFLKIIYEPLD